MRLEVSRAIHTLEKEYTYKVEKYIIISPPERLKASLNPNVQLCLEVVSPSVDSVLSASKQLGLKAELRLGSAVASYARTPLGNYLIDCYCESWQDIKKINSKLNFNCLLVCCNNPLAQAESRLCASAHNLPTLRLMEEGEFLPVL